MTEEPGMVAILLRQKERVWKCAIYLVKQVLLLRKMHLCDIILHAHISIVHSSNGKVTFF